MNNTDFKEMTDKYVPNFMRFRVILWYNNDIVKQLESMLQKVYDAWLLEAVGKHINLELWLCILKDQEIDQVKLKEMMNTFKK